MKIFITGGTGFVGKYLSKRLSQSGHQTWVLTRSAKRAAEQLPWAEIIEGDPKKTGPWQVKAAESEAIINLAGTSIFTIWTDAARKSILNSRVLSTRNAVDAFASGAGGKVFLSASAVGYYGSRLDDTVLEESSPPGNEFMSDVCMKWEQEALRAEKSGARVVVCRFGVVLGREGGALAKIVPAFRFFLGGRIGSGRQWFPWIHEEDLFRIFAFALEKPELDGPVNSVAPNPVKNEEFVRTLAQTVRRPVISPPVPAVLLRAALGEFADVLLKGQRAVPKKLLETGFSFQFPTLAHALADLLGNETPCAV